MDRYNIGQCVYGESAAGNNRRLWCSLLATNAKIAKQKAKCQSNLAWPVCQPLEDSDGPAAAAGHQRSLRSRHVL